MKVLIDLETSILDEVSEIAVKEKRSRKQMLEILIERQVTLRGKGN